jgi:UDP-glucuronate 4-epimerase
MDFVNEIEKNLNRKGTYDKVPAHPADAPETWSDTTKLQGLGYKPTTPISEGVKQFISWYKDYYNVN